MRVALIQINSWLGDFKANAQEIIKEIQKAHKEGCDLAILPEAALFGYHPCDLLERSSIVKAQLKEMQNLHKKIPKGMAVIVGAITPNTSKQGKPWHNSAVWLERGLKPKVFAKELLPTYDVFDESRHIEPGKAANNVMVWRRKRILVTICEDIWGWPEAHSSRSASYKRNPLKKVKGKVDLVINLSASPFSKGKLKRRHKVVSLTAKHFRAPMIYVNMVGSQDELIFDGGSFAVDKSGKVICECARFVTDFNILDLPSLTGGRRPRLTSDQDIRHQALLLGLRDFSRKNGFAKVHLGLSGGVDSAVVACLAVEALGKDQVTGFAMPGPFSDAKSLKLAQKLAHNLGIKLHEVPISSMYESMVSALDQSLGKAPFGILHENIQARLRAMVLMGYANRERSMLLATSNKSELATGYSTLYGDMCGGLMPIGDLLKGEVYQVAEYYNRSTELIPPEIISRPPSAELRPGQKDQDSLPPYDELDVAVEKLVEDYGEAKTTVEKLVLHMLMTSEFKRWQAPPILKVSDHAFGRGRRLPLSHRAIC